MRRDSSEPGEATEQRHDGEATSWRREVAIVWVAVLIALMGMSLVIPFLPLYLKQDLGVPEEQTRLWAGWVGGANFFMAALCAPLWGSLADRYGRKPMAIRALVGLAVAVGLMGFAQNVYQLFALRMLQGAFGGFVAAAIALVGTTVPRDRLGGVLGFVQTAVVGGNLIGPLLGGELSHHFGYRATFQITGGALVVAMLLIVFLVRERHSPPEGDERRGVVRNVRDLLSVPTLRWVLLAVVCAQTGLMLVNPQISLFVEELLPDSRSVERWAGLVTAAPGFASFLAAPLWGRAGDRRGHATVLTLALLGAGLVSPWAAAVSAVWHLVVVRFMLGGFTAAMNPCHHSVVAHQVEEHRTAGAFSLLSSAQMLGACIGPFASGPLAASWGVRPLFPLAGALLLAAACAVLRVRRLEAQAHRGAPSPAAAE
ncbi:MAG: MFS transporter [Armatimonadota bacterium]